MGKLWLSDLVVVVGCGGSGGSASERVVDHGDGKLWNSDDDVVGVCSAVQR